MANIHLIIGEDDYLVSETAKKLTGDGTGLEVVDSNMATNAELQLKDLVEVDSSFSTPPFLDPVKTTWWKNVKFLPQSGKGGPSEDVKEGLEKFARKLASLPPSDNQRLIISGPKLLMSSVFAKTLKPVAEFAVFASGKPWERAREAVDRVRELAADMNLKFDRGAAELFVARVGADSRSLISELGKMRDYLGPEEHVVTEAAIGDVTSQGVGVEPEVWSVTDAVGERNLAKAMDALKRFEGESGFAVFMTTVLEKFFRQLVELADAQEKGCLDKATEGMAPFAVRKNTQFLRNWTLRELRVARARLLMMRERAVSSGASVDVLLISEIVRICRRPAAGGGRR